MSFPAILSTTVKNISGGTLFFAYLGRHGKSLENNASHTEDGDLVAKLSGRSHWHKAMKAALASDLQNAKIAFTRHNIPIDQGDASTIRSVEINGSNAVAATAVDYT